ncbi:MAG: hypothetical protein ACP6IP_03870 [Candidatus Njordarchaeia archaeon]
MLVEEFREAISKNAKLLAGSFKIANDYPETFLIGSQTDSRIIIEFDKNKFKKFLKKVDLLKLPVKFQVEYLGYGILGIAKNVQNNKKFEVEYKFFAARKSLMYNSPYKDFGPGDKAEIDYIAVPFLLLPSIAVDLSKRRNIKEGDVVKVYVIHEYHLKLYTKIKDAELLLARYSWYPNVAFPEITKSTKHYYENLLTYIERFFKENNENYFHEIREDRIIAEIGTVEKPLKLVLVSPYYYNEKVRLGSSTEKMIKEIGFGNIKKIVKLGSVREVPEHLKHMKADIGSQGMFTRPIKIFLGKTGMIDDKERIKLRVVTGKAVLTDEKVETFTEETEKVIKFQGKHLKKRKEIKLELKIPRVGTSFMYTPDNNDVKALAEIIEGRPVEILSITQFDELLNKFEDEGLVIPGFEKGVKIFPYVKIELSAGEEVLVEQIIPYLYGIGLTAKKK